MRDKLLPCPFCGSSAISVERGLDVWPVAMCDDCGALGPCIELDREKANALWNARSVTSALPDDKKTL